MGGDNAENETPFSVGDEVVFTFGRSWRGKNGSRATVTRVGRKWAYAKDGRRELVFDRISGEGKVDRYGTICQAYRPADYEAHVERQALENRLLKAIRNMGEYTWQRTLSNEQIVSILEVLDRLHTDRNPTP